jgi:hypothetical protein
MFDALSYRSCLEPLLHIYILLVFFGIYIYPFHPVSLESVKCLALLRPVEVG